MSPDSDTHENKSLDPLGQFRELLLNGSIDDAHALQEEFQLPEDEVLPQVQEAFQTHRDLNQFREAIRIGLLYNFDKSRYMLLFNAEWKRLIESEDFEAAAEWAQDQGLSEAEVKRAASQAYEDYVKNGRIEDALKILNKYGLKKEEFLAITISEFNRAFERGEFLTAARLGSEFNFSAKRTYLSAVEAVLHEVDSGDHYEALSIISQFSLISDGVFEELDHKSAERFSAALVRDFLNPLFAEGKLQIVKKFIEENDLLQREFSNPRLQKLSETLLAMATDAHNSALRRGDEKTAQFIRDSFHLFTKVVAQNVFLTMIDAALSHHIELIRQGKIGEAVRFKNEYQLFSKYIIESYKEKTFAELAKLVISSLTALDLDAADVVINEYSVPDEYVRNALYAGMRRVVEAGKCAEVNKIVSRFDITLSSEDERKQAKDIYRSMLDQNENIQAAQFADLMKLGKDLIEKAAHKSWSEFFLSENFDAALEVKNRFKLPKRLTTDLVRRSYQMYLDKKQYDMAVYIRKNFGLTLSLTEWFVEFFRMLFKK